MKGLHTGGLSRRRFLEGSAFATLGLAFGNLQVPDGPNQHNMLVVGEQTVFLSHLPMFQAGSPEDSALDKTGAEFTSPHRFQVILEATFSRGGKDVTGLYAADRRAHATTRIYTLEPNVKQPFVLSRLFTPAAKPQLRSFTATVFRGHLEQGGEPIQGLSGVRVEIRRVVHGRKFNPKGQKPAQLEYLLFGKGSELFLAHAIMAPPDFDQVFSATIPGRQFTESELSRDVRVAFPDRKNVVADRLREGEKVSGSLIVPGDKSAAATRIDLQATREFYFEEGELLVPHTFDPTPEELGKKP
jgi:hypothetical protein